MQMANKHKKCCSTSSVIKKMIENILVICRYRYIDMDTDKDIGPMEGLK